MFPSWWSSPTDPRLTIQEQSEVYIGYHHTRAQRRTGKDG